jgi:hypothetical protein
MRSSWLAILLSLAQFSAANAQNGVIKDLGEYRRLNLVKKSLGAYGAIAPNGEELLASLTIENGHIVLRYLEREFIEKLANIPIAQIGVPAVPFEGIMNSRRFVDISEIKWKDESTLIQNSVTTSRYRKAEERIYLKFIDRELIVTKTFKVFSRKWIWFGPWVPDTSHRAPPWATDKYLRFTFVSSEPWALQDPIIEAEELADCGMYLMSREREE